MGILATKKTLLSMADRIGELSNEISDLKRASRSLELEFTELYDKVRHQMSRMAKRAAVATPELPVGNSEEQVERDLHAPDAISASILARRGMRRPPT